MIRNVGNVDRVLRLAGAAIMGTCAFMAPFAAEVRLPAFGKIAA
jgi:hypothetical protein